jgi:NADPH-dependent curcumin reductase CurA
MHFAAAYALLRKNGRIAVCGSISQYNTAEPEELAIDARALRQKRQRIESFGGRDWLSVSVEPMTKWWREGKIAVEETRHNGIEKWATAFQSLFTGGNTGKVVVTVAS